MDCSEGRTGPTMQSPDWSLDFGPVGWHSAMERGVRAVEPKAAAKSPLIRSGVAKLPQGAGCVRQSDH